jgi:hypothetical protein
MNIKRKDLSYEKIEYHTLKAKVSIYFCTFVPEIQLTK